MNIYTVMNTHVQYSILYINNAIYIKRFTKCKNELDNFIMISIYKLLINLYRQMFVLNT